jgi:hypothetical protein
MADLFLLQRLIVCGLQMFKASNPECYVNKVRPSIFGYKNNPDFPNGVVFEGVLDNQPQFRRGETGAQSNTSPVLDALLGIEHTIFQMLKVGNSSDSTFRSLFFFPRIMTCIV